MVSHGDDSDGVPPAATVSAVFARWARSGAWQRILDALRDRLRVRAGGPVPDRGDHRLADGTRRRHRAPIQPRLDGGKRTNGVKRHIAVDVNGLLLAVVVTAASIQDRDAAHRLLAALRGSFSTIPLVWADGGYPGRLLIGPKTFSPLLCRSSNASPAPLVSTSGPAFEWSRELIVDRRAPPLRARLRNQTRPPRSHGPPRHDHDHDQATRPNLTVFKHPLTSGANLNSLHLGPHLVLRLRFDLVKGLAATFDLRDDVVGAWLSR